VLFNWYINRFANGVFSLRFWATNALLVSLVAVWAFFDDRRFQKDLETQRLSLAERKKVSDARKVAEAAARRAAAPPPSPGA
jgi:hypothetical protein